MRAVDRPVNQVVLLVSEGCGGLPGGAMVKNLPAVQEMRVRSWVRESPRRRKWQPTPGFLSGKSHGLKSLEGYSPWGNKVSDRTE